MPKKDILLIIVSLWFLMFLRSSFSIHRDGCIYNERRSLVNCRGENWSRIPFSFLQRKCFHTLDLGINNIKYLNDTQDLFELQSRDLIETVLLDHNRIENLPSRLFDAFPNLRILDLSNNRIKHISHSFCHITSLTNLILDGNPIERISKNAFVCIKNLKYLSLAHCNITHFPFKTIENLNAKEINLSGNQIENVNDVKMSCVKF